MDKIIGLGNALVDVLATLKDDTLLDEMGLPKGSMQLIDDAKLQQINTKFSIIIISHFSDKPCSSTQTSQSEDGISC